MKENKMCRVYYNLTAAAIFFFIAVALLINNTVSAQVYDKSITLTPVDVVKIKKSIICADTLSDSDMRKYDLNNDGTVNVIDMSNAVNSVLFNEVPLVTEIATTPPETDHTTVTTAEIITPEPTQTTTPSLVVTTTETTTPAPAQTTPPVTTVTTPPLVKNLNVPMVLQAPELPTGCEATTLTMLLNYYGFNVSKQAIADMMPQLNFYYLNGVLYGADFRYVFPGNPRNNSGYGCYAPCMVKTAENYFNFAGNTKYNLVNISGTEFELLLNYVAAGKPVMAWATMGMISPGTGGSWMTPAGDRVTWIANEHCLLITGYDKTKGIVYVNDPMKGRVTYTIAQFKQRYNQMNSNAAVLMEKGESFDPGVVSPLPPQQPTVEYKVGDVVQYTGLVYYSSYGGSSVWISGTYTISDIIGDTSRPYRIRLGLEGWIPHNFK